MALTIVAITAIFIVCAIVAYKAKQSYPTFTDEQLLNQHVRFMEELDSSRKYIGATYFHEVEKGSPAEFELTVRGYDVKALMRERAIANREDRPINWDICKKSPPAPKPKEIV